MLVWRRGRLFWKILIALWLSMSLTIVGTTSYFYLTGQKPPPGKNIARVGVIPVAPLVFAGIAIVITGTLMAWQLSRSLSHLGWALRRLSDGHLDTRVLPLMGRRRDEIADLAWEFDQMASRLQKLTDSRRVLLHDISHELRSPLTRMQAAIGLMKQDPSNTDAMVARISREADRLDALVEVLLTLHKMESGAAEISLERLDVVELLASIAEDAEFEALAVGRRVNVELPAEFITDVNGELIYRAYENVVRNAVKFTRLGTCVNIAARIQSDGEVLVTTVADHGPGVDSDKLEAIFQPFTRLGGESVPGIGLGLAIARRAIEMHGGRITAETVPNSGLLVTIYLPKASAAIVSAKDSRN